MCEHEVDQQCTYAHLYTMFYVYIIYIILYISYLDDQDNVECNHMLNSIQIIKFDEQLDQV